MPTKNFSDNYLFFELEPWEKDLLPILSNLVKELPDSTIEKFLSCVYQLGAKKQILEPDMFPKEKFLSLSSKLRTFLVKFFSSPFSKGVFQEALRIGVIHTEKAVSPSLFLNATFKFLSLFRGHIKDRIEDQVLQENLIQLTFKLFFYLTSVAVSSHFKRRDQEFESEIARLNRIYMLLREINLLIFEERNSPENLFKEACEILVKKGGFDLVWIGLIDSTTKEVKPIAAAGKTDYLNDLHVSIDPNIAEGCGPCGEALRIGKPVIIQDTEENSRFVSWKDRAQRYGLHSVVALPLTLKNEVKGGLLLYHSKPQHFTSEEVHLLSEVARDLSLGWTYIEGSQELERMLYTDEVTELGNVRYFVDTLEHEFEVARKQKLKLALIRLDLEKFSLLNHNFGRTMGDQVLKEVGKRLVNLVGDLGTAVRSGADDFSCSYLFENNQELRAFLRKIKDTLSLPINFDESSIRISASIGIALFPDDASTPRELLEASSVALKRAKEKTPWGTAFYSEKEARDIFSRWRLAEELELAYKRNEFVLFFQPRVDLLTRRVASLEALLRWKHPERGLVSPGEFIPVLEESGLIIEVGKWVIEESASFLKKLLSNHPEISVSFNVSVKQIQNGDLVEILKKVLKEVSVPPEKLEVEITESLLLEAGAQASEIIEKIHTLGLKLSIDDFGTGYSSFTYLKKIPANNLKIDYSFVREIPESREDAEVVMAIIAMARNLGKKTVAEGVERLEQLAFLMGLGVDEVQGYYFARPMPEDKVLTFLSNFKPEKYF